jgi:hypothetical protein
VTALSLKTAGLPPYARIKELRCRKRGAQQAVSISIKWADYARFH